MKKYLFYLAIIGLPMSLLGVIILLNFIGKLIYG